MAAADQTKLAVIANDITYMKEQLKDIGAQLGANYVTKEEFAPIKRIVYGMVGVILVGVLTALMALIVRQ